MKKIKHFIAAACFTASSAVPAIAQSVAVPPACTALDRVLSTVAIVKRARENADDAASAQNLSELELQLGQISLQALFPQTSNSGLKSEQDIVARYLGDLQASVDVSSILSGIASDDVTRSLASLDYFWGCAASQNADALSTVSEDGHADFFGPESLTSETDLSGMKVPSVEPSTPQAGRSTGNTLNRVAYNAVSVDQETTLLLFILGAAALLGGVLFYLKRREIYEARELRSLIHSPIKVRIGAASHDMLLVDVSMNGAKIKHADIINSQGSIEINLGGRWHMGQIKWNNTMFAGVMFKTPLDAATFDTVMQAKP